MFKLFKRLTSKEIGLILMTVVFICLTVYLELEVPTYMSEITTLLQTPGTTTGDLWVPGLKMLGLSFASLFSLVIAGFVSSRMASSYTTRLREDIFNRVLDYSNSEIKKFSIPSLLTRTTNDITQIQVFIAMGLQVVIRGSIMAIWAMTKVVGKSDAWLIAVLVAVAAIILMTIVLVTLAFPKQSIVQTLTDKLNSVTRESLTGIRVVRAYNAEDYQDAKFGAANDEVTSLNIFINRFMSLFNPIMSGISSGLTLAIYWIGAYLIHSAASADKLGLFSDMVVFMSYGMQVVIGFLLMGALFIVLPRTLVSAGRINKVLALDSSIKEKDQAQTEGQSKGQVTFEDVSFRYAKNSEAVIEHVSFTAKAGETVAFIGSTGSGKSTLVNLIPRFYDVTEGRILVDGVDVRDYELKALRNKVGYIPQKAVLFSGTIASNLDFGESMETPLDEEKMWEALELAQAKSFVEEKEAGLESEVSQGGTNYSGGQRQRLAIARALARKPEILIFDDSFSALDYKTDRILRKELAEQTQHMTKLIVAQRISTIMDADQILVLDNGKVVGQGTHKELLATNEVYQEIAYSQLSKEELENGK
ncbi:ABC transporter ATP-binding protein [Streptococcus gordonii]|jgi:ABC-type multidrug/protein/lipid transport system, ATPase component|uniref:ABC-type multidrug/protein/lipid transport system, ATPase component n=1 Tax=Streptococcus gordonii (strain Challis / ATCC 35105 / BCRC 15272 / CH1 / DL1 / V288) TaxID=467705 RepID=A8AZ11_STRGC|nr:ABC transporter ATP-binding protein [Streptococcus gordonii]ABV09558.1 ABC-type multidrug/protein/lipid transport system, ATPase component [Streptococcus gordonii str. Challis substr. CH1]MBZ2137709.1 ABC transporter ATP-binding protein/permease [Streptococcus gordonii]MCG4822587.1 ABC transporter ATP-binding protein/permease [Streptococcus gordonii]MCG4848078.1 ABC transporter ATP-binding protein/permease [Streptococcus gordonii]MDE8687548.1 ABC transporter ATP-binding protein [Streptococc